MVHQVLLSSCFLVGLFCFVTIQSVPSPKPALSLNFDEGAKAVNWLGTHRVTCTLDSRLASLAKVISLTLHGAKAFGKPGEFDTLATVDVWSPKARWLSEMLENEADLEVHGEIGAGDVTVSHLTLTWGYSLSMTSFPRKHKCVVNGLDSLNRPQTMSVTSDIKMTTYLRKANNSTVSGGQDCVDNASSQALDLLGSGVQNLTSQIEEVQRTVGFLTDIVKSHSSSIHQVQDTVLEELKNLKFASLLTTFDISQVFGGKRYLASKVIAPFNIKTADLQCELIGGYLLEMDSDEEYAFALDFVKGLRGDNFFTGANDIVKEGDWKFYHSGKSVTFANWKSGQPNNWQEKEDCLEIRVSMMASNDWLCSAEAKFVCEVPA